jgi:hypothetical protein
LYLQVFSGVKTILKGITATSRGVSGQEFSDALVSLEKEVRKKSSAPIKAQEQIKKWINALKELKLAETFAKTKGNV